MKDGSTRHRLCGGPYDGLTVRTYGPEPLPFPAAPGRPSCTYVWGVAVVGRGKNRKQVETFVIDPQSLKEEA